MFFWFEPRHDECSVHTVETCIFTPSTHHKMVPKAGRIYCFWTRNTVAAAAAASQTNKCVFVYLHISSSEWDFFTFCKNVSITFSLQHTATKIVPNKPNIVIHYTIIILSSQQHFLLCRWECNIFVSGPFSTCSIVLNLARPFLIKETSWDDAESWGQMRWE